MMGVFGYNKNFLWNGENFVYLLVRRVFSGYLCGIYFLKDVLKLYRGF